eukprot:190865-Amphidinium_carterae.4
MGRSTETENRIGFILRASDDMSDARMELASYTDAVASSVILLSILGVAGEGGEAGATLLVQGAARYWIEHSGRATMATWAQRLGIVAEVVRLMGAGRGVLHRVMYVTSASRW